MRRAGFGAVAILLALGAGSAAAGQEGDAYLDAAARELHRAAVAHRERTEQGIVRYTALVKQRMSAGLRVPLRDRTLYHAEAAARVFWERDGETLVQALGSRGEVVGGTPVESDGRVMEEVFDPSADPLFFGLADRDDDDVFIVHPLEPGAVERYRFASGDTLTLSLPDGRRLRAVELEMRPRDADPTLLQGALWIEPESGALVRAAFRLARAAEAGRDTLVFDDDPELEKVPGLFLPITVDLTMMTVQYALWEGEYWLPRTLRSDVILGAGVLRAPGALEVSYAIESVVTERSLAAAEEEGPPSAADRHFATRSEALAWLAEHTEGVAYRMDENTSSHRNRRTRYLLPEDTGLLANSPHLPPPVWEEAPGFASPEELEALAGTLADLPRPVPIGVPRTFYWGPQRPDLLRYNRVEGLSVGARGSALLPTRFGPVSVELTGRLGHADLEPRGGLAVIHETLRRKAVLEGYHELRPLERGGRALGPGNSAMALLFGRDDGDYMQATGARAVLTPPSAERAWLELSLYAEHQHGVGRNTDASLAAVFDGDRSFRDVRPVTPADQLGASLLVAPWWGSDPSAPQAGLELWGQAEMGDARFGRASAALRGVLPLADDLRAGAELGAGTTWGDAPPQRDWLLGGPSSLRGYAPATLAGPSFTRARVEVSRSAAAAGLSVFGDAGWTGERDAFALDDALLSMGVGLSLLDGLVRLDVARGLRDPRGTRVDLYLDGIL